jgi:pimeloyl-ACP methyl ester carboxylesterase
VHEAHAAASQEIVFLHGSPLSGRMWLPQFDRLPDFHCLAPDLPEHGQSAHIEPFDVQDVIVRLIALIRESSPKGRANLVGLSFGGVIAQALMVQAPDVVDRVILSGTAAPLGKLLFPLLKAQLALNRLIVPLIPNRQLSRLFRWQFGIPPEFSTMLEEDIRKVAPAALMRLVLATYSNIVIPSQPRSPVLVVVGEKENWIAKRMARRLKMMIPGATAVMAPGVGHVWNLQAPQLFAEMVRAWLTDKPLPEELLTL